MDHETRREKLFLLMQEHKLSNEKAAQILGVNPRAVRSWLKPEYEKGHRTMPHTKWYVLTAELEKMAQKEG